MAANIRQLQMMNKGNKVSKKPDMPMIMAEEEEEETLDHSKESEKSVEEETEDEVEVPEILMNVLQQPWFPKSSLGEITADCILGKMINVMSTCAPLTYNKICNDILAIHASNGLAGAIKEKTLELLVDNLSHSSARIRRASLKVIKDLNCASAKAVAGIVGCLNDTSVELQHDALNALEHLLGIKDKEGLKDLFISLDILSRSPSPEDVTSLPYIKHRLQKRSMPGGERGDWRIDKESFIKEWLSVFEQEKEDDGRTCRTDVSSCESRNVKLATSIISKLKLYKKEPRLSIVDLRFDDSSSSTRARTSTSVDELEEIQNINDVLEELQKTKAGCKLLSRMGYRRTTFIGPPDDSQDHEYLDEKRPPSKIVGKAYGKMEKETTVTDLTMGSRAPLPDIRVSEVSTVIKEADEPDEVPDLQKLVLPKIFNRIKSFRQNVSDVNLDGAFRVLARGSITVPVDDQLHDGKSTIHHYSRLPGIAGSSGKTQCQQTKDTSAVDEGDAPSVLLKPGKRLILTDDTTTMDCHRRQSILKNLQRRRINLEQISPPAQSSETRKSYPSTTYFPELHDSPERAHISSSLRSGSQVTPEIRLPKVDVSTKLAERKKTFSDGTLITNDKVQCLVGTAIKPIQYSYPSWNKDHLSGVTGERLLHSLSVCLGKDEVNLDNELLRVLPVGPKLTVDTGRHKWGRSRYGILELLWTAKSAYESNEAVVGSFPEELGPRKEITQERLCGKKTTYTKPSATAVKRLLKPIKNRNLVANPYTDNKRSYLKTVSFKNEKLSTLTSVSERLPSVTPSNSASVSRESLTNSNQTIRTEGLITVQELLNVTS